MHFTVSRFPPNFSKQIFYSLKHEYHILIRVLTRNIFRITIGYYYYDIIFPFSHKPVVLIKRKTDKIKILVESWQDAIE